MLHQLVPVMRAGLVLLDHVSSVIPANVTYHIGLRRDENTLEVRPTTPPSF